MPALPFCQAVFSDYILPGQTSHFFYESFRKVISYEGPTVRNFGLEWVFRDNRDWGKIRAGLRARGFSEAETGKILGNNWLRFFTASFASA